MKYSDDRREKMSYLGEDIKKLGFGLMRLPQKGGACEARRIFVSFDAGRT